MACLVGEKGERYLTFVCPEDTASVLINSIDGYWIRFRIIDINNNFYANSVFRCPWLKSLKLKYDYKDCCRNVELLKTLNNSSESPLIDMKSGAAEPVRLLSPLTDSNRSVYICFKERPQGIPINMYFQIISKYQAGISESIWSAFCEERGTEGWIGMRIEDGTSGFSRSGNISIESGYEMTNKEFFRKHRLLGTKSRPDI